MNGRRLIVIFIFCGLGLVATLALLLRKDQSAHLGEEIQMDDFAFSALELKTGTEADVFYKENAPSAIKKFDGESVVIKLKIVNRAKRVDFTFRPETAYLSNRNSRRFTPIACIPNAPTSYKNIPAGAEAIVDLIFETANCSRPFLLRFSFGQNAFLDFADLVFFGNKQIIVD